jgi:hypothetical protein
MVLLSGMMRTVAITGRTDSINAWFAGRQGGRWAQQTVAAAFPMAAPHRQGKPAPAPAPAPAAPAADPIGQLKELAALKEQGILTDEEFAAQKARILDT